MQAKKVPGKRGLQTVIAGVVLAALAACGYNPAWGLEHRAKQPACSGKWVLQWNGYPYGDPRLHGTWVYLNTDRRPACGG